MVSRATKRGQLTFRTLSASQEGQRDVPLTFANEHSMGAPPPPLIIIVLRNLGLLLLCVIAGAVFGF